MQNCIHALTFLPEQHAEANNNANLQKYMTKINTARHTLKTVIFNYQRKEELSIASSH